MMLLAHLLHQNPDWRRNSIWVLHIVSNEEATNEAREHIISLAASSRISVEPVVIVAENVSAAIQSTSQDAAVVLIGFEAQAEEQEALFFHHMEELFGGLPRVLFVDSAGGMELES